MAAVVDGDLHPVEGTFKALFNSFVMIIFSEIGDKTFLIAAILAMRHPRVVVFAGAFGSLFVMSILSAAMGHLLPKLIPKQWTQVAAAALFLVFGAKMVIEGRAMKSGNEKIQEEMREAQEEIEGDDAGRAGDAIPLEAMEEGGRERVDDDASLRSPLPAHGRNWGEGMRNFCSFFLGPVFVQAFVLTFLGEWGDRSQIATIALGAAHVRRIYFMGSELFLIADNPPPFVVERVPRHCRHGYRPLVLHRTGSHRRPLCLHKNIC